MSKSNVNPSHYKVAGRERQGEDIAQARNKQTHAESVARRRTEPGARFQKPAPREGGASARAAKTATQKARMPPLKTSPGQKRGRNLVPGSAAPHARFPKATGVPVLRPTGAAPPLTKKPATKKASIHAQGPGKRIKQSMTQKRTISRGDVGVIPAAGAGLGGLGKGRWRRRPEPRT